MTWQVTIDSGDQEIVLPNGLRYQGSAQVVLSDEWYGQLSADAVDSLLSAVYLGGTVTYTVTLGSGLDGVVLPDGLRHAAGDVVDLTDEQYSVLTADAVSTLFASVVQAVS